MCVCASGKLGGEECGTRSRNVRGVCRVRAKVYFYYGCLLKPLLCVCARARLCCISDSEWEEMNCPRAERASGRETATTRGAIIAGIEMYVYWN